MQIYIKFESQTAAVQARRVLQRAGIPSALRRNPNPNHKEGCNYALFVRADIQNALQIINEQQIENLGIEQFRDGR